MSIQKLDEILVQFKDNTRGVEYIGLYSRDALLIHQAGQWNDEDFIVDLQVKLLELKELAQLGGHKTKQIWLEGKDGGYLISIFCQEDNMILVKADPMSIIGQLKTKLEKTLEKIQAELMAQESFKITQSQVTPIIEKDNTSLTEPGSSSNSKINYRGRTN